VVERDRAQVQVGWVNLCSAGAMGLQALLHHAQKDTQRRIERALLALQVVAQPFGYRQNPLAHWQAGEDMIGQVRSGLGHAAGVARGADAAAFAGEGDKVVVATVVAPDAGKAVGEDAAFEVFAESFLYVGGRRVVVALAIELACAGELKPGLEVLGHRAVQQGALGVAGVVGFGGLGWLRCLRGMRVPTRVMVDVLR